MTSVNPFDEFNSIYENMAKAIDFDPFNDFKSIYDCENAVEIEELIKYGWDVNNECNKYISPLWYYSLYSNIEKEIRYEIIRVLLDNGADVNISLWNGYEEITLFNLIKELDLLELLFKHKKHRVDLNSNLHKNVLDKVKDFDILKFFIEKGANIKTNRIFFIDIFRDSYFCDCDYFYYRVPRHFRENKKVIKYLIDESDKTNEYPTELYNQDNAYVIEYMIENGADVNEVNSYGITPLFSLIDNLEIVKVLVNNGADVNGSNEDGKVPLHQLIGGFTLKTEIDYNIEIFNFLIDNGADINIKDNSGNAPFHYDNWYYFETEKDFEKYANNVLSLVDVNLKNGDGLTYLHVLLLSGDCIFNNSKNRIIMELIVLGADINSQDNEGNTVLEKANNDDLIAYLLSLGAKYNEETSS